MSNQVFLWKGAVEPAEVGASGNQVATWKGAVEPAATVIIARKGGVRWLREPDPEIREDKEQELVELIKPNLAPAKPSRAPQSSARTSEQPPGPLLTSVQDAAARMSRPEQVRLERLLEQTGISLRELLILLE